MRHLVPVVVLLVLGASGVSAQDRGVLAIGVESARHAFSLSGEADAVNMCGTADCEVVATFAACLAVAHSRSTAQGEPVWTWMEARTEGATRIGARPACGPARLHIWLTPIDDRSARKVVRASDLSKFVTVKNESLPWGSFLH